MDLKKSLTVVFILAVLAAFVFWFINMSSDNSSIPGEITNTTRDGSEPSGDSKNGELLAGKSAPLYVFDKQKYEEAITSEKLVVLYFYANWCPICRVEFPKMVEAFNRLETDDVVGFRVNFNDDETDDDERDIAREFTIPYQHTKVFVRGGDVLGKYAQSWESEDQYIEMMNAALSR